MSDNTANRVEERIAALRKNYLLSLPDKITSIVNLWEKAHRSVDNIETLHSLQQAVHTLSGSGATFGAVSVSRLARELDELLGLILELGRQADQQEKQQITKLISELQGEAGTSIPQLEDEVIELQHYPDKIQDGSLIFIIENDRHVVQQLTAELKNEHHTIKSFDKLNTFKQAYRQQRPDVVIMEMEFTHGDISGDETLQEINRLYQPPPPLIFISTQNDMNSRLKAVKAGASRYFSKPLQLDKLSQTVRGLTQRLPNALYRVMIVDDDASLAEYYATLLQSAGMSTQIVTDPMQVLAQLQDWSPDLIMMDVYMPHCSGLELAAVIRQDETYTTMPIVFLSSETDIDKQLYALDLGGDAFLTKPVIPQHLLSTITARVKRSRWLTRLKSELEAALENNECQRKEIQKKEERLRFSQYFANIGSWDLSFTNREMYWSEKIAPLLGYGTANTEASYEAFLAAIHPDDKVKVVAAIEACSSTKDAYEIEHRVVWPDGSVRWLLQKGDVIRDDRGIPVRMLGVVQDTTQRKQLERDLATQKEFAVQANSAKSEFLSRMSHELRTPLNAIIGFAQLLESDGQQPLHEHQQDSLDEILKASNHLLELIDEVLDLAKIEAGKIQLHIEETPVIDVLLESYSMMIPMAEANHIQLDFKFDQCEDILINTDRTKLKQVMFNLMSNAIKYNKPHGKVTMTCEACGTQRVRMRITDTGVGIPRERQSELFKAFNRLGAEASDIEGTGIGLMISKKIIEMMGGELGFHSEQGEGTVFWVEMSTECESINRHPNKTRAASS